jgi:hypothetical protein
LAAALERPGQDLRPEITKQVIDASMTVGTHT